MFEIAPVGFAFPGCGNISDLCCNMQVPGQLLLPVGVTELLGEKSIPLSFLSMDIRGNNNA